VYSWHIDESEKEVTAIRAYGLNKNNENVCIRINDFTPYVYVQLPDGITWNEGRAQIVCNKIDDVLGNARPIKKSLVFKKKLYYAHIEGDKRKLFPFLFLSFSSPNDIRLLSTKLFKPIYISGLGMLKLKIHENNAPVVLQLTCAREIPTAGWIQFKGDPVCEDEKLTYCQHEYNVKWKTLSPMKGNNSVINPMIMSYDIEVYSSNPNKMPSASNPKDVVFQISLVFCRNGDGEDKYEKSSFSLRTGSRDCRRRCEPIPL
jgi:DNA polymerase elongation subunit (family B)